MPLVSDLLLEASLDLPEVRDLWEAYEGALLDAPEADLLDLDVETG